MGSNESVIGSADLAASPSLPMAMVMGLLVSWTIARWLPLSAEADLAPRESPEPCARRPHGVPSLVQKGCGRGLGPHLGPRAPGSTPAQQSHSPEMS